MPARLKLAAPKNIVSESLIGKLVMLKLTVFALLLSQLIPVMLTSYFETFGENAVQERLRQTSQFENTEGGRTQSVSQSRAKGPKPLPVAAIVSLDINVAEPLLFQEPNVMVNAIPLQAQHDCKHEVMPTSDEPTAVSVTDDDAVHVRCGLFSTLNADNSLLR